MGQKISRRDFARKAAGAVVATSAIGKATGQAPDPKQDAHPALPLLSKRLAKPIPDDLKAAVSSALTTLDGHAEARAKHRLNDGSEPSTRYVAQRPPRSKR